MLVKKRLKYRTKRDGHMEIKTYYGDERDKGYELAIDLLIHGVSKKQIMDVLGISKKLLYSWRRNADIVLIETFERYNTEYLLDAANYLMFEFMYPQHPKAHFRATDSQVTTIEENLRGE